LTFGLPLLWLLSVPMLWYGFPAGPSLPVWIWLGIGAAIGLLLTGLLERDTRAEANLRRRLSQNRKQLFLSRFLRRL
jgi:hypothetical protein